MSYNYDMITQEFISNITKIAEAEITKYHSPSLLHFHLSQKKGRELAENLHARIDLVSLGTTLMDIKLGEALHSNQLDQHVKISLDFTKQLLEPAKELTREEKAILYNCVSAHHGQIPHNSQESEIVTNADCYRFIHPTGVFEYLRILSLRQPKDYAFIITQAKNKLVEKWSLVSLPIVKKDLKPYYNTFLDFFSHALKDF